MFNVNETYVSRKTGLVMAIMIAVIVSVFSSCHKAADEGIMSSDTGRPVRIAAGVNGSAAESTKGLAVITSESLRSVGFGGQAYWTDDGERFCGFDEAHEYVVGEHFVYERTESGHQEWQGVSDVNWPVKKGLSFFFWAPWLDPAGSMLQFPLSRSGNLPRGRFTQAMNPAQQVDFCLAEPVFDLTEDSGLVNADFHHALTRVRFYFNITGTLSEEEAALLYRVKSLTLEGIAGSNCFTYDKAGDGFVWDQLLRSNTSVRNASYVLSIANGTLVSDACPFVWDVTSQTGLEKFLYVNSPEQGCLFVLPQPMTHLAKLRLSVGGFTYAGGVWTETRPLKEKVILLPEQNVWHAGETIVYTASIDVSQWIEDAE